MKKLLIIPLLTASVAHAAISTGLSGHYALDEASGSTLTNQGSEGNGSFGGIVANPGTSPGRVTGFIGNGALSFDGTDQIAQLDVATDLYGTTNNPAVSVSFWFNATTLGGRPIVFQHENGGTNFGIDLSATNIVGRYRDLTAGVAGGAVKSVTGTTTLSTGEWYLATFTHAAGATGAYNLYLNGMFEATVMDGLGNFDSIGNNVPASTVGAFDNSTNAPAGGFNGSIDDIGTWQRAIAAQEVAAIHAMGRFEGLNLSNTGTDDLITAFNGLSSTTINGREWTYIASKGGALGEIGGSIAGGDAYVILDGSGNAIGLIPEPSTILLTALGTLALLRRRRS